MHNRSLSKTILLFLLSSFLLIELGKMINDIWGTQLRLVSAIFAENLLAYSGMEVSRTFTVLTAGSLTFDIIPSCNGSESIKAILICSSLLAIMNQQLKMTLKFLLVLLSLPLAILMNSLRISALISLSCYRGEVIHADTMLHTTLGLVFFSISIVCLIKTNSILSQIGVKAFKANFFYPSLSIILITLLPFFAACFRDWKGTSYNTNDQFSFLYFLWGLIAYFYLIKISSKNHQNYLRGTIALIIVLLSTCCLQFFSPGNYALGLLFICALHCLNTIEFGCQNSRQKGPLLLIIFMGFPKTNEKLMEVLNCNLDEVFFIKFFLAVSISLLVFIKFKAIKYTCTRPLPRASYKLIFTASCLLLAIQLYSANRSFDSEVAQQHYFPYLISDWEGYDMDFSGTEELKRTYKNMDNSVGIMIIPSYGDRKNIHTPEYCQYGIGWEVVSRSQSTFQQANVTRSVSKLLLKKDNVQRQFIYWFQYSENSCASYSEFIALDTLLKLQGKQTNWKLFVVWTDQNIDVMNDFLPYLPNQASL